MNVKKATKWVSALIVTVSLFTSATCSADGYHHGNVHGNAHGNAHGNVHGHDYGRYHGGHYHEGYHGGWGWGGPNIIIGIPAPRYYAPYCETVRVCDQFDRCWLEQSCH